MPRTSLIESFRAAFAGIEHVLRNERNAKIEAAIGLAAVVAGLWLGLAPVEWAVVALTIAAVVGAEIVNSALEAVIDLLAPEVRPSAKIAKDSAAGAVLVLAIGSVVVGLFILGPPLLSRLLG